MIKICIATFLLSLMLLTSAIFAPLAIAESASDPVETLAFESKLIAQMTQANDECDTTTQCKALYGDRATDCQNSQTDMSICLCGSSACRDSGGSESSGFPGSFRPDRDLFLPFFDNRPDADDIHSQAGIATLLADGRFKGVDVYSVLGTYGRQGGAFLNSATVMDQCIGAQRWTNAHPKDGSNWSASLARVLQRAEATFGRGGDLWIMEAGQSDFSADLLRLIQSNNPSLDTRSRVHIVQHSDFNQRQTTPSDLTYVRNNADYQKIPDGNQGNNGSPRLTTREDNRWSLATSLPNGLGACWSEARRVADANNFSGNGHFENPSIEAGGFDFSDVVEATWIFGFNSIKNVDGFFDQFPQDQATPPDPTSGIQNTGAMPAIVSILLLDDSQGDSNDGPVVSSSAFKEQDGLIVVELESLVRPNGWQRRVGDGALGAYLEWTGGDNFNRPGRGVISFDVQINNPGTYQFLWRSSIRNGTNPTEHNDSWLRIEADNFYGAKGQSIVCPNEKLLSNRCVGGSPNGSSRDGWFKIFRSGRPAADWFWQANTSDNDSHAVLADFDRAGVYTIKISGRSNNHGIDRLVLFRSTNPANNVSQSFATSPDRPESLR